MKQKVYICYDEHPLPDVDGQSIFQQQAMFRFYLSLENYKPFFILIEEEKKVLVSLLGVIIKEKSFFPALLVSRCLIIGDACFFSDNIDKPSVYKLLLDEIDNNLKKKCLFIEFRHMSNNENLRGIFEKNGYQHYPWFNIISDLTQDTISSAKKRQIKRGLENGATIITATKEKQIRSFYCILRKRYSSINKPLPPLNFFIRFFHDFCKRGKGTYLLVEFQNKIIGGIMCLFNKKETIYEWYVASLHKRYRNLYPGVLSTYAAIEYGQKNGFHFFDFMGAGRPSREYGVRDFKLTFGGKLEPTSRWQKINYPFFYKFALFVNKLLSKK